MRINPIGEFGEGGSAIGFESPGGNRREPQKGD